MDGWMDGWMDGLFERMTGCGQVPEEVGKNVVTHVVDSFGRSTFIRIGFLVIGTRLLWPALRGANLLEEKEGPADS